MLDPTVGGDPVARVEAESKRKLRYVMTAMPATSAKAAANSLAASPSTSKQVPKGPRIHLSSETFNVPTIRESLTASVSSRRRILVTAAGELTNK
mgnify:CR=1 FL=1